MNASNRFGDLRLSVDAQKRNSARRCARRNPVPALQHLDVQEAQCADVQDNRVDRKLPFLQKVGAVAAEVVRSNLVERYVDVPLKMFNSLGVRVNRSRGVVAANEFFPHSLNEYVHRDLLSL